MGPLLVGCGPIAAAIGGWRSYAVAREALVPLSDHGDPTRMAIEATRPLYARARIRVFLRRVATSVVWLAIAMYGLYLVVAGAGLGW